MSSPTLSRLFKLPANGRAELAMALWDSLGDAELTLSPEQEVELDRRWAAHLADPTSAVPWEEVRRRLLVGYAQW